MADLPDLDEALRIKAHELSEAEARLAAHLVEHPDVWGYSPTTELARTLRVHRSTIVRFAQRLGFDGYPALQETVRIWYLQSVTGNDDLPAVEPGLNHHAAVRAVYERELRNLRATYAKLDLAVLEETAVRIAEARHVLVFGRRFSHAIAQHTANMLRSLRPGVRLAPEAGGSSLDSIFDLGPEDAAVVVSLRRHSPEVQRVLRVLTEQSVPCTLITDASPLAKLPEGIETLQAHIGSTSTLESFTSLVSVGHALATIAGELLAGSAGRQAEIEAIRRRLIEAP
ncbi:MAG: MurR/RpiR family transcriptional regulator [Trueperaceae bacterium]|nr:MurR/RpiR family transcriptional regulator [Trueperaceae bacterium]